VNNFGTIDVLSEIRDVTNTRVTAKLSRLMTSTEEQTHEGMKLC
jgi:hypothetical protein